MRGFSPDAFGVLTDELKKIILFEQSVDVSEEALYRLLAFRYREKFGLSMNAYLEEPYEAVMEAHLIWSIDAERAKKEEEKHKRG